MLQVSSIVIVIHCICIAEVKCPHKILKQPTQIISIQIELLQIQYTHDFDPQTYIVIFAT